MLAPLHKFFEVDVLADSFRFFNGHTLKYLNVAKWPNTHVQTGETLSEPVAVFKSEYAISYLCSFGQIKNRQLLPVIFWFYQVPAYRG